MNLDLQAGLLISPGPRCSFIPMSPNCFCAKEWVASDHPSSSLWQHPFRAVESPRRAALSPRPGAANLILFVPVYHNWSGDQPPCYLPGPHLCALIQDNFYYLQITGCVTQLPSRASVPVEQQPGQGQTSSGQQRRVEFSKLLWLKWKIKNQVAVLIRINPRKLK